MRNRLIWTGGSFAKLELDFGAFSLFLFTKRGPVRFAWWGPSGCDWVRRFVFFHGEAVR